jgi:hypothetical protein
LPLEVCFTFKCLSDLGGRPRPRFVSITATLFLITFFSVAGIAICLDSLTGLGSWGVAGNALASDSCLRARASSFRCLSLFTFIPPYGIQIKKSARRV